MSLDRGSRYFHGLLHLASDPFPAPKVADDQTQMTLRHDASVQVWLVRDSPDLRVRLLSDIRSNNHTSQVRGGVHRESARIGTAVEIH